MRQLVLAALFSTLAVPAVAQQRAWTTAIGLQGGYARVEATGGGSNDEVDFFNLPGPAYVGGLLTYGGLFVILPVGSKVALEPSMSVTYLTTGTSMAFISRLGLRANYAFGDHFYAAAGGAFSYIDQNPGANDNQLGVHMAGGYRFGLSRTLNGRVELGFTPSAAGDQLGPTAVYSLLFGLSSNAGGPAPRPGAAASRRVARLGFQGGFSSMTQPEGSFNAAFTTFPLVGGSVTGIGSYVASPPTLFLLFPVGSRTAIEAGVDFHRVQQAGASGPFTSASANLAGRLLVTVSRGWYAAGGVNLNYIKVTDVDGGVVSGVNLGWGYDFPVGGNWRGRTELNFQMMKENEDLSAGAQNVLSLLFALSVPLK